VPDKQAVVGVIGLGVMGGAMSGHVAAGGHEVVGFDTDPTRLKESVVTSCSSVTEVAEASDVVLMAVPTVDAVAAVSEELGEADRPGLVVVEMGTFPIGVKEQARRRVEANNMVMLDAPVSGTGLQAADATLIVYASGDRDGFAVAEPVFALIGTKTYHLGKFGNGSSMKLVANLLVAVHTLAAAEAHRLGAASGLDPDVVQEVIAAGAGSSRMFEIRGPMMAAEIFDPPSARLSIILKDATIIAEHAAAVGSPTPLLAAALPWYEAGVAEGIGHLDAAALHQLLKERSDGG
jgi:3-hydroxyisobutyrate dehydrogenase-like beta-hydroxyacid dehydrogenase